MPLIPLISKQILLYRKSIIRAAAPKHHAPNNGLVEIGTGPVALQNIS